MRYGICVVLLGLPIFGQAGELPNSSDRSPIGRFQFQTHHQHLFLLDSLTGKVWVIQGDRNPELAPVPHRSLNPVPFDEPSTPPDYGPSSAGSRDEPEPFRPSRDVPSTPSPEAASPVPTF